MSYRVLARKWRPQKFEDIVGQEPIVRTLQNALRRNRVAHAMIFSGVRGVGKTTIARIMAKAINCHNQADAPCDHCSSCEAIVAGNAMDLHEIDGASNRGIQEIRDLKENIRFMPVQERFKVVIIDEVHMLTTEAFNALLKTLEEPPEHVFFMFATTEIHKVPVTILSRCQRYELKRVPFKVLNEFFATIAVREGVTVSQAALDIIAGEADGSVRDGLSLLDQIFSFGGDTVSEDDLRLVLGLVDRRIFAKISEALLAADLALALTLLNETYCQGMDLKRFAHGLLFFCRALLIGKTSKAPAAILDISDQEMALVKEIAAQYSLETLSSVFGLMMKGVEELQYAAHPRMVLEMLFVKTVQAGSIVPVSSLLSRLDLLLSGLPQPVTPTAARVVIPTAEPSARQEGGTVASPLSPDTAGQSISPSRPSNSGGVLTKPAVKADVVVTEGGEALDVADDCEEEDEISAEVACSSGAVPPPLSPAKSRDVQRDWDAFIAHVRERKKWMAGTLAQADKVKEEDGALTIFYDEASECHMLQEVANQRLLIEFAQDFFQKELALHIVVAGESVGGELDQPQEERRALANDPRVQIAVEVMGGRVTGIRTGPRSR
ncbi:MAG: DNA polymerase III subunit gamma/tau [Desulfobulbaceae bacterium]|nr:DNA polymerase III subunit gamma/tau [Desulfobulbaceae bacterium]